MRFSWFRSLCWVFGCSVLALPLRAHAQAQEDHLQPAKGYYTSGESQYYTKVAELLLADLQGRPLARVVVLPSLLPEYALSLDQRANAVYLTYRSVHKTSIWQEVQTKTGITPALDTKELALQPEVATALTQLFAAAIGQTRYPKPTDTVTMRGDGTTFTFIYRQPHVGWQAGEVWSPAAPTLMGRLVALVEQVRQLAIGSGSPAAQTALLTASKQLTAELAYP